MKIASLAAALLCLLAGCIGKAEWPPPAPRVPGHPRKAEAKTPNHPEGTRRPAPNAPAAGFPITVTDADGREVTLAARPERVISLSPAHTETLYALGAG